MDYDKLCFGCFEIKHTDVCPYCGFDSGNYEHGPLTLPPGSVLAGRYLAGRALGQGGFGITYIGFDLTLEIKVAIKEFLPQGLVLRASDHATVSLISKKDGQAFLSGVERFTDEARILAKLAHIPGIVKVSDYFQENATAYFVMEYVEGMNLKSFLQNQGGRIPYEQAFTILRPLIEALAQVHEMSLLHRDISTDNIYITSKGQTKLLDFGAARYALGDEKSLSVILKHGYAPEEQYRSRGNQGPWTDVYALCATLYTCITGALPPDSIERLSSDNLKLPSALGVNIPPHAEKALEKALAVRAADRTPNMTELLRALAGTGASFAAGGTVASTFAAGGNTVAAPNASSIFGGESESDAPFFKKLLRNKALLAIIGGAVALIVVVLLIALPKNSVPAGGGGGGSVPPAVTPARTAQPSPSRSPETSAAQEPGGMDEPEETAEPSPSPGLEFVSEAMRLSMTLKPGWSASEQSSENGQAIALLGKNGEDHAFVMYVPGFGVEDFRADMDDVIKGMLSVNPDLDFELSSEEDMQISAYDSAYFVYNVFEGDAPWGFVNLYVIDAQAYGMERACYLLGSRILVGESMDASIITDTVDMFFTLKLLDAGEPVPTPSSGPTPMTGASIDLKAYSNDELGIRCHYPAAFEFIEEQPNDETAIYFLLDQDDWMEMISIYRGKGEDLEAFLTNDEEASRANYDSLELVESNDNYQAPSGSYNARIFDVTQNGVDYKLVRIAGQLEGDLIIFTLRCETANFELIGDYGEAVMSSLSYY